MTRIALAVALVLVLGAPCFAADTVVASTPWAAALARAAGAEEVVTITPEGLQHPPDYDPKPSDLVVLHRARFVILGGFEGFAARMREAAHSSAQVVTVRLSYDPVTVETEVLRLGTLLGTQDKAEDFVQRWRAAVAQVQGRLQPLARGRTCLAHAFLTPWAEVAGIQVLATFGPKPLSLPQLGELSRMGADFILDNAHMPQAQSLAEASGAQRLLLRNFPHSGQDVLDVLVANAAILETALARGSGTASQ